MAWRTALTREGPRVPERAATAVAAAPDERLRILAIARIRRLRRLRLHLAAFALGLPLLGLVWVLTEYFEESTWPSRFASAPDVAGTWDPWFFFVAGIWAIALVIHALWARLGPPVGPVGRYIRRPVPREQLDRKVERLRAGRRGGWHAP